MIELWHRTGGSLHIYLLRKRWFSNLLDRINRFIKPPYLLNLTTIFVRKCLYVIFLKVIFLLICYIQFLYVIFFCRSPPLVPSLVSLLPHILLPCLFIFTYPVILPVLLPPFLPYLRLFHLSLFTEPVFLLYPSLTLQIGQSLHSLPPSLYLNTGCPNKYGHISIGYN